MRGGRRARRRDAARLCRVSRTARPMMSREQLFQFSSMLTTSPVSATCRHRARLPQSSASAELPRPRTHDGDIGPLCRGAGGSGSAGTERNLVELVDEALGTVAEHVAHAVEPRLVEPRHDGAAALSPDLEGRGDEALPHERLEDFREHALVEGEDGVLHHVLDDVGVRHDHEDLGPEAELVQPAALLEVLEEREEERTANQVVHHALRLYRAVLRRAAVRRRCARAAAARQPRL